MEKLRYWLLIGAGCLLSGMSLAQGSFQNCTAAFLGSNMVVNEYSPTGKCQLPATATGELTLCTVDLSPTGSKAVDKIEFSIAIRDKDTGTLTLFSSEIVRQVPVQTVLAKCKKGDHIVLLTLDRQYAVPHNEILVL